MEINITYEQKQQLRTLYASSSTEQKTLLEAIFGKDILTQSNITERIKTFQDACTEIGINHDEWIAEHAELPTRTLALQKLEIIAKAINDGWKYIANPDTLCHYPWFKLTAGNLVCNETYTDCIAYDSADKSITIMSCPTSIAFSSAEIALYAGQQFLDIYRNFILD